MKILALSSGWAPSPPPAKSRLPSTICPGVSLDRALADAAYRSPEEYAGRGGFSWIHRWSKTKGMPPKGEPDPPSWVEEAFQAAK